MAVFLVLMPNGLKSNRIAIWIWIGGEAAFSAQRILLLSRPGEILHPYIYSGIAGSYLPFMHATLVSLGLICQILAIKAFQQHRHFSKQLIYGSLLLALLIGIISSQFLLDKSHHTVLLFMFGGLTLWQATILWPLITHSNGAKMLFGINIWIVQYSVILVLVLWLPVNHGFFNFTESIAILNDFFAALVRTLAFALMISERSHQSFSSISVTDTLTGSLNRRGMSAALEKAWRAAVNKRHLFVVTLLDIDHFSQINEQYGRDIGDDVLYALANRINEMKSGGDVLGRWGGDQFMLLLKDIDANEALMTIARICSAISEKPITDGAPAITISAGLLAYPSNEISGLRDLLSKVNESLLKAKINRNCTVFFNPGQTN